MIRPFLFVQTDRDKNVVNAHKMILHTCQI